LIDDSREFVSPKAMEFDQRLGVELHANFSKPSLHAVKGVGTRTPHHPAGDAD